MTDKEKIRAEIERRLNRENEILWNAKLRGTYASPSCEYNLLTLTSIRDFIDSLPGEPTPKGYDEAYLNECIAKASKTWEGVDVDKYMNEVRGGESDDLKEAIDAEIVKDIHNLLHVKSVPLPMPSEFKFGDKVKIVILRDESKND